MSGKFIKSIMKTIIFSIFYNKVKQTAYFARFYGLSCSFLGIKSFYRIVGCSILVDTKYVDKNDMFDENIFLYFEEVDLCKRIKSKNGKIFNSSILKIEHLGHKGSAATDPEYSIETEMFRNWHWMWSSFYYYKKHNNYLYALFKMSGKFIKSIMKTIIFSIFYNKVKQTAYFARFYGLTCSFLGIKSFYRVKSLFK